MTREHIHIVAGPTASGKTALSIQLAKDLDGEILSVDSRQVYRTLDIGTEKITFEEMQGIPHYLIDIRDPEEQYSAGDFVNDASKLITDILSRGKTPILAGGTHFYFDALLYGLPKGIRNDSLRIELEKRSVEELFAQVVKADPRRAARLDPQNKRRIIRSLELIAEHGHVPERNMQESTYDVTWHILNPERDVLRARIRKRLIETLDKGLIEEVRQTRERVGDERLNELGLEYKIVGEYLRGEREYESLIPTLSSRLWHYARHQKQWLRRLCA
jgi:tRNA dimethylallyltransferase